MAVLVCDGPQNNFRIGKKANNDRGIRRMYWGLELLEWWLNGITINHPEEDFKQYKQRLLNSHKLEFLSDSEDYNYNQMGGYREH